LHVVAIARNDLSGHVAKRSSACPNQSSGAEKISSFGLRVPKQLLTATSSRNTMAWSAQGADWGGFGGF
jgi:hypothetical protein